LILITGNFLNIAYFKANMISKYFEIFPSSVLHDLRQRVVSAVEEQGVKAVDAMRIFGVGRTALFRWLKSYRSGGIGSLVPGRRGRTKGHTKLKPHQAATIVRLIEERCPDQLKLPFALWTREAVRELIHRRTGLSLSVSTVGRLLRGWGFTPQNPVCRAYEKNPAFVRQWMESTYPSIRRQTARSTGATRWA
jgi:transposase